MSKELYLTLKDFYNVNNIIENYVKTGINNIEEIKYHISEYNLYLNIINENLTNFNFAELNITNVFNKYKKISYENKLTHYKAYSLNWYFNLKDKSLITIPNGLLFLYVNHQTKTKQEYKFYILQNDNIKEGINIINIIKKNSELYRELISDFNIPTKLGIIYYPDNLEIKLDVLYYNLFQNKNSDGMKLYLISQNINNEEIFIAKDINYKTDTYLLLKKNTINFNHIGFLLDETHNYKYSIVAKSEDFNFIYYLKLNFIFNDEEYEILIKDYFTLLYNLSKDEHSLQKTIKLYKNVFYLFNPNFNILNFERLKLKFNLNQLSNIFTLEKDKTLLNKLIIIDNQFINIDYVENYLCLICLNKNINFEQLINSQNKKDLETLNNMNINTLMANINYYPSVEYSEDLLLIYNKIFNKLIYISQL